MLGLARECACSGKRSNYTQIIISSLFATAVNHAHVAKQARAAPLGLFVLETRTEAAQNFHAQVEAQNTTYRLKKLGCDLFSLRFVVFFPRCLPRVG